MKSTQNTTEEWKIKIKELNQEWYESVPESMMLELCVYVHNLALSQVLEKMYTLPSYNLDGIGEKDCIMFEDLKVLITSLQKE